MESVTPVDEVTFFLCAQCTTLIPNATRIEGKFPTAAFSLCDDCKDHPDGGLGNYILNYDTINVTRLYKRVYLPLFLKAANDLLYPDVILLSKDGNVYYFPR